MRIAGVSELPGPELLTSRDCSSVFVDVLILAADRDHVELTGVAAIVAGDTIQDNTSGARETCGYRVGVLAVEAAGSSVASAR